MSVYSWEKDRRAKLPGEVDALMPDMKQKQIEQYKKVFKVFKKYSKVISGITFWNVSDRYSWRHNYLGQGRKNYPLLFDTANQRKKAYEEAIKLA